MPGAGGPGPECWDRQNQQVENQSIGPALEIPDPGGHNWCGASHYSHHEAVGEGETGTSRPPRKEKRVEQGVTPE